MLLPLRSLSRKHVVCKRGSGQEKCLLLLDGQQSWWLRRRPRIRVTANAWTPGPRGLEVDVYL
jgi:hypothetical protein